MSGEESLSARERAYQFLRHRLITLDLAPGTVLDVAQLMQATALGKTPIVEALQRLALEDLLTIHPRRGTVVTEASFSQARHIFDVRDILEGRSARLAAQRATSSDVAEMRAMHERQIVERSAHDYARFLLHDYELHLRVAQVSGNPLLLRALDHLLALNMRLWFVFFRVQGPQTQFLFSHEPILNAIEARDPEAAEAAAIAHVAESNHSLLTMFHAHVPSSQSQNGKEYGEAF